MWVIVVQQRVANALYDCETFSVKLKPKPTEIEAMNEIAYSSMILHLFDHVVRQVDETNKS